MTTLSTQKYPQCLHVRIEGRIDTLTAADVQSQLETLLENESAQLLLDFSQVPYISSTGLRILLVLQKKAKPKGGQVILCSVNPDIQSVLSMAGFTQLFVITPTPEEGLASFQ